MTETDDKPVAARRAADTNPAMARWQADLDFVTRMRSGDAADGREFARRVTVLPAFLRARNRKLGSPLDESEIPDLVQDVLVIAWRRLESFEGRSTLETWVCAIGSFELMNALRRKQRRQRREQAIPSTLEPAAPQAMTPPGDLERLEVLLEELPAEDAQLLRLRHHDSLSFPQLAERLSISPSGAKNRYYRLLERLRRRMHVPDAEAPS